MELGHGPRAFDNALHTTTASQTTQGPRYMLIIRRTVLVRQDPVIIRCRHWLEEVESKHIFPL